ncbi:MAG: condensation domain-containing protein, partial [Syntrophaceae bacterium]|nr:condensation domain-containing protein [Syntrophaceae bacterium]
MSEYPLTYFQMRLWYFDQLEPNTPAYNMSFANRLFGPIDIEALNESVNYITRRHPSLRATFTKRQTDPVQIIEEFKPFSIDRISAADTTGNDRSTEIQNICLTESSKGFDLARGPMYRWVLINLGDNDNVLLFVVHQMVCDTCSLETIMKELMSAYSAIVSGEPFELGPESFHVGQYAVAETEWMKTFECETQIAYWTSKLGNVPEPLELPTDFSRPAFQRFKGSSQSTVLDASLALKINKLASRYDTTLFIVVLAAFKSLLFRYTNQDDLCVGYQIDNRHRLHVNDAVGSF